jgi:hypothetical protein
MTADNSIPAIAGQGLAFDGIDDQIMFSNRLSGNGESTIGAWVKQLPDATGLADVVIAFGDHRQNAARVLASFEPSSGRCKVGFANNDLRGGALAMGVWTHLVWVWDEATYSSIYIDGRRVEGPTRHLGANTFGNAGRIGNATIGSADYFLFGALDEVRVAPVAHSSAWVLTEYNSQRPGSTFIKSIEVARPDDDH